MSEDQLPLNLERKQTKQGELYKRLRPMTLKGVVGQEAVVSSIQKLLDREALPHCILLSGPSGSGKTTIARILRDELDCGPQDFHEINCADFRGVDFVRDVRRSAGFNPINGSCKIWMIDEAHKLTNDAQNAFLKLLEDTPSHVYFILATTDPRKLIKTVLTRCTEFKFEALSSAALRKVVMRGVNKDGLNVSEDVVDEIVDASDGSARKALVLLDQVGSLEGEETQIRAVHASSVHKDQAIELARALINNKVRWPEVGKMLRALENEDAEGIRYLVLGYCRAVMLGGGPSASRAYMIIDIFAENFYDSKQAGLAAACWEVMHAR